MIERDALGARPVYFRSDGKWGERARPLCLGKPRFDRAGILGDRDRSAFSGVQRLRPGHGWHHGVVAPLTLPPPPRELEAALLEALEPIVAEPFALWLSSGLDSALLLALAVELGKRPTVYILQPDFSRDYDESEAALAIARRFSVAPIVVRASVEDFLAALPATIAAAELPLWNLHPAGKRILAQRTRADGFSRALTGDGADEAFAPAGDDDYLPLVTSIARAAGVDIGSPFFAAPVVSFARAHAADAHKTALRALAIGRLPEWVYTQQKAPRLAPPLDLARFLDGEKLERLARALDLPLTLATDRDRVRWATLRLLADDVLGADWRDADLHDENSRDEDSRGENSRDENSRGEAEAG